MTDRAFPMPTLVGIAVFAGSCIWFGLLLGDKPPLGTLAIPAALGWLGVLVAARPLVAPDRRAALYFALAILALMIFFVHQTYGYEGKVRNFPLIMGYTGIVLSLLDIVSLTGGAVGATITRFFGSHLDAGGLGGRTLSRELIAFAAMGGCVLGIWLLGFLVFSPVFVLLWMLAGGKTVKQAVYGGIFTLIFIYLLFELAFQYDLYRGIFFIWLLDL